MKAIIGLIILCITLGSCGGYTTGTIQKSEKGFLKFTGNTTGVMISVDDGTQFPYNPKVELYEVKPGKHAVKVYRNNEVVVDRTVIVDNQITFEVDVP